MKKWLIRTGLLLLVTLSALVALAVYRVRDRHPGYQLDLKIDGSGPSGFRAGFAAVSVTPDLTEPWVDQDRNSRYDRDVDTFEDTNGNGVFDAFWMAGFGSGRAAAGVHDDLWARTMVIENSDVRIAIVGLDLIGLFHDDVLDIRESLQATLDLDYLVVSSSHNHEAPDLLGLWGPSHFESGVNAEYLDEVKKRIRESVIKAARAARPARFRVAAETEEAPKLVNDTRRPFVMETTLRLLQAVDRETGSTLGVLVAWADHPETTWAENLLITSDFPHYVRDGIENGVRGEDLLEEGLGGVTVYVNGAIGGLLTTDDQFPVTDPISGRSLVKPSFEKARAQGHQIALLALRALRSDQVFEFEEADIRLRARTLQLPLANPLFRLGVLLGVIDRGFSGWMQLRTEIAAWTVGDLSFVCFPGEIYPEIVEGGVEAPEGRDFPVDPVEVPSVRSQLPGNFQFVLGLANDEVGYIIPKSEWDEEPPYLYSAAESPYGEINSAGPETGPIIHREMMALLRDLNQSDRQVAPGSP